MVAKKEKKKKRVDFFFFLFILCLFFFLEGPFDSFLLAERKGIFTWLVDMNKSRSIWSYFIIVKQYWRALKLADSVENTN